jgi:L-histidine N-alpha-methyltransferase
MMYTPRSQTVSAIKTTVLPKDPSFIQDVIAGLREQPKYLSSVYFYDDLGSQLFRQIMALPDYYLTRVEHEILEQRTANLIALISPDRQPVDVIELGSGNGEKTLTLLLALYEAGIDFNYRPIDVSTFALKELAYRFTRKLPGDLLHTFCGNYMTHWPPHIEKRRQVVLFLGSNLGNLTNAHAVRLLKRINERLKPGDALFLGLDLKKDPRIVLAAYNDPSLVTAKFNLNLLTRINRELGTDFNLDRFYHYASYNPLDGVARSFLVSDCKQIIYSDQLQQSFRFAAGESIYMEQSQKYDRDLISEIAVKSNFKADAFITDKNEWYAVTRLIL